MKKQLAVYLTLIIFTGLLTACGGSSQTHPETQSASGTAVHVTSPVPPIHDQICTIAEHEDMWHKEDVRVQYEGEEDSYIEGPYYSLMDLDQDGYLEIVVTSEAKQECPSFYEVTEDGTLQKWTMDGDLPRAGADFGIFDTTSKADCYYDSSSDQYHYIVQDHLSLSQDDADVTYLDMTTETSGVSFKKIGRHTFDASKDHTFHFFDVDGKECKEKDITKNYSGMTKKTMYFSKTLISKKEAGEIWSYNMEHTMWQKFMLRDDYCPERELSDELRHQFVSLSISMHGYASELGKGDQTDSIRYACTDLDNDQWVEVIIENTTKNTFCINEESDEAEDNEWNTKGKDLTDFTKNIPATTWHTCTIAEIENMSYDLIADNLKESWLHFTNGG